MLDLSALLVKCPVPGSLNEIEVIKILRETGFEILTDVEIKDFLRLLPRIYVGENGRQKEFVPRDIESRVRLYGGMQNATAFLLRHQEGDTLKKIDALVGPASFQEYENPEYSHTLRARFLGPKVTENRVDGKIVEVRIDPFHCCRTAEEFQRESRLYFNRKTLTKYVLS
ncbi:MAG: hypothetical protein ABIE22_03750 [archaeon]